MRFHQLEEQIQIDKIEKEIERYLVKLSKEKEFDFKPSKKHESITQGILNHHIVTKYPNIQWPKWIKNQFYQNNQWVYSSNPWVLINSTETNNTILTHSKTDQFASIDSTGMLTPFQSWSVDLWLKTPSGIRSLNQINAIEQTFNAQTNTLMTTYISGETIIQFQKQFTPSSALPELVCELSVTHKQTDPNTSLLVGFRPYNQFEISPIYTIHYNGSEHLFINDKITLRAAGVTPSILDA